MGGGGGGGGGGQMNRCRLDYLTKERAYLTSFSLTNICSWVAGRSHNLIATLCDPAYGKDGQGSRYGVCYKYQSVG